MRIGIKGGPDPSSMTVFDMDTGRVIPVASIDMKVRIGEPLTATIECYVESVDTRAILGGAKVRVLGVE